MNNIQAETYILLFFSFLTIFTINQFRIKISKRTKLIDHPDSIRKFHTKSVPLLGGIMIFSSYLLINLYLVFFQDLNETSLIVFFSCTGCFLLGLIDDAKRISYKYKFLILIIIFYLSISLDDNLQINKIYFSTLERSEIYLKNFSIPFTVLCLLLLINAINLIDGINGLCISVSIIFISWLMFTFQNTQSLYILLIVSLFYILLLNLKNNIFLGDAGSLFLGSLIGLNLISNYNLQISEMHFPVEDIFIALMLPGLDMLRVFASRIFNKKNPFSPDRTHLHHLLIERGFKTGEILLIFSLLILIPIFFNFFTDIKQIILIVFFILFYFILFYFLVKFSKFKR
jgi:UDP-GlcNAc:undecaprenyl-phosphate GlcNAc-1-phosphate transferase